MNLIHGTSDTDTGRAVAQWFGATVGREQSGPYAAIGTHEGGHIQSAVVLNDYNGSNIELHAAGRMSRALIRATLRYVFLQLRCQRLTAKPYRSNMVVREALIKMGFEPEAVLARYYGPAIADDAIVYRLDPLPAQKWMT